MVQWIHSAHHVTVADITAAVAFEENLGNLNLVYRSEGPVRLVHREELKVNCRLSVCVEASAHFLRHRYCWQSGMLFLLPHSKVILHK